MPVRTQKEAAALVLSVKADTTQAKKDLEGLLRLASSVGSQTRNIYATAARQSAATDRERVRTAQSTAREIARTEKAQADAARSKTNALIAEWRREKAIRDEQERAAKKAAAGSFGAQFRSAISSSRFTVPGTGGFAMPLVGRAATAGGLAATGTAFLAGQVASGIENAGRAAIDFDRIMRNVNSTAQLSERDFAALQKRLIAISSDDRIRRGPADLASALYEIIGALPATLSGTARTGEALRRLQVSALGASAGLTDTKTAAGVLTGFLNSGIQGITSAEQAMDVLFKTVEIGKGNFAELASAIPPVIKTAADFGVKAQEVGAFLATASLAGQSFSDASNDLLNLITKLARPAEESEKVFRQMGVSFGADALAAKGLSGILEELVAKVGDNKQALARLFPDMQALRGALTGMAQEGLAFKAALEQVNQANDKGSAVARANAEQQRSMASRLELVAKQLQIIAVQFGPGFIAFLSSGLRAAAPFLEKLRELADAFAALDESKQKQIVDVSLIGAATIALGGLAAQILSVAAAYRTAAAAAATAAAAQQIATAAAAQQIAGAGVPRAAAAGARLGIMARIGALGTAAAGAAVPYAPAAVAVGAGGVYLANRYISARDAEAERMAASTQARISQIREQIRLVQQRGHPADQPGGSGSPEVQELLSEQRALEGVLRQQRAKAGEAFWSGMNPLATPGGVLGMYRPGGGRVVQPPLHGAGAMKAAREAAATAQLRGQIAHLSAAMKAQAQQGIFSDLLEKIGNAPSPGSIGIFEAQAADVIEAERRAKIKAAQGKAQKMAVTQPGDSPSHAAARKELAELQKQADIAEADRIAQERMKRLNDSIEQSLQRIQDASEKTAKLYEQEGERQAEQNRKRAEIEQSMQDLRFEREADASRALQEFLSGEQERLEIQRQTILAEEERQGEVGRSARLEALYNLALQGHVSRIRSLLEVRGQAVREAIREGSDLFRNLLNQGAAPDVAAAARDALIQQRADSAMSVYNQAAANEYRRFEPELRDLAQERRVAQLVNWPEEQRQEQFGAQIGRAAGDALKEVLPLLLSGRLHDNQVGGAVKGIFTDALGEGVGNELERSVKRGMLKPLESAFKKFGSGIEISSGNLLQAAGALYSLTALLGAQGKRKQTGALVGGGIGAAIGSAFGNPVAGFQIGSFIGGAIRSVDTSEWDTGPRSPSGGTTNISRGVHSTQVFNTYVDSLHGISDVEEIGRAMSRQFTDTAGSR